PRTGDALPVPRRSPRPGEALAAPAVLPDPSPVGILRPATAGIAREQPHPPPALACVAVSLVLAVRPRCRLSSHSPGAGGGAAESARGSLLLPAPVPVHHLERLPGDRLERPHARDEARAIQALRDRAVCAGPTPAPRHGLHSPDPLRLRRDRGFRHR